MIHLQQLNLLCLSAYVSLKTFKANIHQNNCIKLIQITISVFDLLYDEKDHSLNFYYFYYCHN